MSRKPPFLTIAIPAYKRPELLRKTLLSVFSQLSDVSDVEVLIADDSCDETNVDVLCWARSYLPGHQFRVIKNAVNLGIDRNIVNCIVGARGKYVWLLGEDDILRSGSVDLLSGTLMGSDVSFCFVNYRYVNGDHSKFHRSSVYDGESGLCKFNKFVEKHIHLMGFIGGCVINRSAWVSSDYKKYSGTYYSHVGGVIDSSFGRDILVISDDLVLNRAEDVSTFTWSKSTFEVYFSFFRVLRESLLVNDPCLLGVCNASAKKLFRIDSLMWLIAKRADGVYNFGVYRKFYMKDFSCLFSVGACLLSVFPKFILVPIRRFHLRRKFI